MVHYEKAQFYKLLSGEICVLFYHPAPLSCLFSSWCETYIYPSNFFVFNYTLRWSENLTTSICLFLSPSLTMWIFEGPICSGVMTFIYCSPASWKVFPWKLMSTWMEINWGHSFTPAGPMPWKAEEGSSISGKYCFVLDIIWYPWNKQRESWFVSDIFLLPRPLNLPVLLLRICTYMIYLSHKQEIAVKETYVESIQINLNNSRKFHVKLQYGIFFSWKTKYVT